MIKTLEKTGRTEQDAIKAVNEALAELGISDATIEVVERAKSGFLGIGASPALVRASYEVEDEVKVEAPKAAPAAKPVKTVEAPKPVAAVKPAPAPAADEPEEYAAIRSFLSGLLERMNVQADIEIAERDNGGINVNLSGNGLGAIIGRHGETLDAIQHLTNYVVNRGNDKHMHISVDAEAYRSKREESLANAARKMADKAIKYKRNMSMEAMNSYERHVVHTALQNYEGVTTSSVGVEPNRRVVINYVKPEQPNNKPKSREWA